MDDSLSHISKHIITQFFVGHCHDLCSDMPLGSNGGDDG